MSDQRQTQPIVPGKELEETHKKILEELGARTRSETSNICRRIDAPLAEPIYDFQVTSTPIGSRLATYADTQQF